MLVPVPVLVPVIGGLVATLPPLTIVPLGSAHDCRLASYTRRDGQDRTTGCPELSHSMNLVLSLGYGKKRFPMAKFCGVQGFVVEPGFTYKNHRKHR